MREALPHELELIEQMAVEGIIKGYSKDDLAGKILKEHPEIELTTIENGIRRAMSAVRDNTLVDLDKIIPQHVEIYEQILKEFEDLYFTPGKLKAMKGKEKLLGLHKESNYVEIHNEVNVEIESEAEYDIGKLENAEQKRLSELMQRVINK